MTGVAFSPKRHPLKVEGLYWFVRMSLLSRLPVAYHVIAIILGSATHSCSSFVVGPAPACCRLNPGCTLDYSNAARKASVRGTGRVLQATETSVLVTAAVAETIAVGLTAAVVAQLGSALGEAFKLADYRTTSGHDLRLDERVGSMRRGLHPHTGHMLPLSQGDRVEAQQVDMAQGRSGASSSTLGTDMEGRSDESSAGEVEREIDWRDEVALVSGLGLDQLASWDDRCGGADVHGSSWTIRDETPAGTEDNDGCPAA
ncbi:unnamed protein product [Discosporangium mesarthrocarpum]